MGLISCAPQLGWPVMVHPHDVLPLQAASGMQRPCYQTLAWTPVPFVAGRPADVVNPDPGSQALWDNLGLGSAPAGSGFRVEGQRVEGHPLCVQNSSAP